MNRLPFKNFRFLVLWIYLLFTGIAGFAAAGNGQALSSRIANYDIELSLDTENKRVTAHQVLLWKNPSQTDTISELQFHLYYNAFKNTQSTFFSERNEMPGFLKNEEEQNCQWSWIKVQSIKDEFGNDLTVGMEFIQPDDDNENDQTVLRVPLVKSVLPGQSIRLNMDWTSKIPNIMPRTGYNKDFYFMAQWFPKTGVYEPAGMRYATKGQWNCHQYHAQGEYYSDFGVYNVSITVPEDFVVGASGVLQAKNG